MVKPLLCLCLLLIVFGTANAQTFTYDSTRPNCSGNWADGSCWTSVNSGACPAPNIAPAPTNVAGCPVYVEINGTVNYTGDMYMGEDLVSIEIKPGAKLTISGDMILEANQTVDIITNNAEILVSGGGGLVMQSGTNTILNLRGDDLGQVTVSNIDLENYVKLNVHNGGALVNSGQTKFAGQGIVFNVDGGFFRTDELEVTGKDNEFNLSNGGFGVVDQDMKFAGGAGLAVTGASEMEIGGIVHITNNVDVDISIDAEVRYCGTGRSTPTTNQLKDMEDAGIVVGVGCRVLPVVWWNINADYIQPDRKVKLQWSTSVESNSDYFVIERSLNGITDFKPIGKINGKGWSFNLNSYEFLDQNLPILSGTAYYRIKEEDVDGSIIYSKTLRVNFDGVDPLEDTWRLYPNPSNGQNVKLALLKREVYEGGPMQLTIFNGLMRSRTAIVSSLDEVNAALTELMEPYSDGLLIVEVRWDNKVSRIKLLR